MMESQWVMETSGVIMIPVADGISVGDRILMNAGISMSDEIPMNGGVPMGGWVPMDGGDLSG